MAYCADCDRYFEHEYQLLQHRAFKHDDWAGLDKWYARETSPTLMESLDP